MNSTKKNKPASDDPVNTKIQRQFNLVFDKDKSKSPNENNKDATIVEADYDLSPKSDDSTKASMGKTESKTISLDLKTDSSIKLSPLSNADEQGTVVASNAFDATKSEGLDFSLNFSLDGGESTVIAPASAIPGAQNDQTVATSSIDVSEQKEASLGGFVLDELDLAMNLSESTQKTVVANLDLLKGGPAGEESQGTGVTAPNELNIDALGEDDELNLLGMSKQEEKAIIESTIKDIVRPKFEPTTEMDLNSINLEDDLSDVAEEPLKEFRVDSNTTSAADDNVLDFGGNTPGDGFNLDALKEAASNVDLGVSFDKEESSPDLFGEVLLKTQAIPAAQKDDEFSLLSGDDDIFSDKTSFDSADSIDDAFEKTLSRSLTTSMKNALSEPGTKTEGKVTVETIAPKTVEDETLESLFDTNSDDAFNVDDEPVYTPPAKTQPKKESQVSAASDMPSGTLNTEDSMRFQATIRALREEREDLLGKIKLIKSESKELEQDNLTLKANLDEAKIEITILRKRHMVELEDLKYRLSMSEEKKALAEEKARQAELRKEKLEQKVRIDFNQVKQREKELESKLELLSMDVDSQVQSRDQKILELRRKIDALEFNMENASIKEQKSLDDKRKLEDRLNKIMKTLRHSIKNLEDDIDHASDENDREKDKN